MIGSEWLKLIEKEIGKNIRILVKLKDILSKALLEEYLDEIKIKRKVVSDFKELYECLKRDNTFQIILIEISKNEKVIESVIEEIKKISPYVKIFLILDYFEERDLGKYFESGVDEIILKPFTLSEFKARLFKILKEHYLDIKLQKFIVEDPLTKVYNRRYFEEIIKEEVYKAIRQKLPLSIMMIDLDKFKWYNDNFGHQAGDSVLKEFGKILLKSVRNKIDKVCRYGGDEFVVILPYTNWKKAFNIGKRIIQNWKREGLEIISLSVGIAQLIEKETVEKSVSFLINRSDSAMYKAKSDSQNKCIVDEESIKQFSNEVGPNED